MHSIRHQTEVLVEAMTETEPDIEDVQELLDQANQAEAQILKHFIERLNNNEVLKASEIKLFRSIKANLAESPSSNPVFISAIEVAEYAKISRQGVHSHVRGGKLIQQEDGTFLKIDVDNWIRQYRGGKRGEQNVSQALLKQELKNKRVKGRREQLKLSLEASKSIPRAEVERQFGLRCSEFTRAFQTFSQRVAHKLAAKSKKTTKEVIGIMDHEAKRILQNITRPLDLDDGAGQ